MINHFFNFLIEIETVHHDDIATAEAGNFDVSAHTDDLEEFAVSCAGMGFFHLDDVVKVVFQPFHQYGTSCILTADGTLGRPGIVRIAPVKATMKPAPAERLTSRIVIG